MNAKLEAKLKKLPSAPGVYFHKSKDGEIIYVGKAAVLKNRVRQYFQTGASAMQRMDTKTRALVAEIYDTDWTETESEIDALFLESEMVKRYMPRYNILLRDDKSQMYVRIDMKSEWPHVSFTRNPADDNAEYYGPYYNGFAVRKALRYLRRIFPYYVKTPKAGERADLYAHIGLSPTPGTTSDEYKASLRRLIKYLEGGRKTITRELEKEMQQAAKNQEFEAAARLRNRLRDLAELQRRIMFGDSEFMNISKDMALARLADILQLPKIPARIEAYDISHMSGAQVVASMVVFSNGVSNRSEYRKFKLAEKNDDTGNMRETLIRRLKHLKDWGKPDLVVIDGGLPQLGAVADLLRAENIAYVGRNKSGNHSHSVGVQLMVPGGDVYETLALDSGDHVARLIARLDEEAHRFAVSYHTTLKRQKQTASDLEEIPGIGPATRRKLIRTFGSLRAVKNATYAQLVEVLGESRAAKLKPYL